MKKESCLFNQARSDEELVGLVKNNDPNAFQILLDRYQHILMQRANRYANIAGVETEDFLQEGRLALYRAVKKFDPVAGVKFNTYAITCIHNAMSTAIKTHLKNAPLNRTVCLDEMDKYSPREMLDSSLKIQIEDALLQSYMQQIHILLSDFEWHVLQLYLQGTTYQQAAVTLAVSVKAVDNALQRVRRKLRPVLRSQS